MSVVARPLVIYDGDCKFCLYWIDYWRALTGAGVDYVAYQELAPEFPNLPLQELQLHVSQMQEALHLVEPSGAVTRGAEAVFLALSTVPGYQCLSEAYRETPGFARLADASYRFIARHRPFFFKMTRLLWGARPEPATYFLTRWLFLRALGLIYLVAFVSLWKQAPGLIGPHGITPVVASNSLIQSLCACGVFCSILLVIGLAPVVVTVVLWGLYYAMTELFGEFLWFQWDALLLEMGLLATFLPALTLLPRRLSRLDSEAAPSAVVLWLFRWLLFRLMFGSGLAKLASGDPTWHDLTALRYHYETQPLPTWLGWYAHQAPLWWHQVSAAGMFAIELLVPFLIFLPRRPRLLAFWLFVGLMALIDLTGNYGFFGWQTCALSLFLLDDTVLRRILPLGSRRQYSLPHNMLPEPEFKRGAVAILAVVVIAVSLLHIRFVAMLAAPLRSINSYGLFSVMTTTRNEIIIEGSNDGKTWQAYEFLWKPGNPARRPAFAGPYMPRLDWQMWFAALGSLDDNPWLKNLMVRLLEGSPEVLALLKGKLRTSSEACRLVRICI